MDGWRSDIWVPGRWHARLLLADASVCVDQDGGVAVRVSGRVLTADEARAVGVAILEAVEFLE